MKPIGLAIWGLHHQHPRWYWPHLKAMPEFAPLCVCDADGALAADKADGFGVDAHDDPGAMLARDDVEAVLVFVPHRQMPEAVARCVAAGKHVLAEKPMGGSAADAARVSEIAAGTGLKVTTGFYWRFNPAAARIRGWIDEGLLGRIVHLEARFNGRLGGAAAYVRDGAPWMLEAGQGGSPMFNIGVHWIDLLYWLTGLEVTAVQGVAARLGGDPPRATQDIASGLLEYAGGAVGVLDVGYTVPASYPRGRDLWISIRGTLGCADWIPSLGAEDQELLLASEHASLGAETVRRIVEPTAQVAGYAGAMGRAFLADFAGAIRSGREVSVPVSAGQRAAEVAEAVLRSAADGKRVVLRSRGAA